MYLSLLHWPNNLESVESNYIFIGVIDPLRSKMAIQTDLTTRIDGHTLKHKLQIVHSFTWWVK